MLPLYAALALAIGLSPLLFLHACESTAHVEIDFNRRLVAAEVYQPNSDGGSGGSDDEDDEVTPPEETAEVPVPPVFGGAGVMYYWSRRLKRRIAQNTSIRAEVS